jgi:hypothetical protein
MDRGRVMGAGDAVPAGFNCVVGRKQMGEFEANMNRGRMLSRAVLCALLVVFAGNARLWAQKSVVPSRVVETVDDTQTVRLQGNVHPLARAAYDQGALADSQPMTRMLLLLQRSPAQELALGQLLDAQQTKGSGSYHTWLTPVQFGTQFGPSDADVQAVTDWLTRQGFQVAKVAAGRNVIEFSGNVGQVRNAFHTEIHRYVVKGAERFANVSDPAIPEALAPVVKGVVALHNFPKHPSIHKNGLYRRYKGSNKLQPLFTYGGSADYAIGPGDFAKIYNIPTGATGAGQSIALIEQSNINTQDVIAFRSMFGLPAYSSVCTSALPPTCQFSVIVNGVDPGILGPDSTDDEGEADLDSQWAGAIAPGANIYLVVSESTESNPTQVSQGVDLSALYAVDNNLAPAISYSYIYCEAFLLTAGNQFYNSLWEQAAAQGITVSVAAGDSGPAACDPYPNDPDPYAANQGVAVSGLASTPYNVALGGTDFDPSTTGNATYWNTTNDTLTSALKYIPEITWDNSACALGYPGTPCTSVDTTSYAADLSAGSGGPSNCISGTENSKTGAITCNKSNGLYGYAKPSFQSALTPADSVRDIPDVSFFASNGGPLLGGTNVAYVVCQSDTNPQNLVTPTGASCNLTTPYEDFSLVGGTSTSAPAFAAVMALVNQSTGQRQGNANYVLYNLAASDTTYYMAGNCVTSSSTGTPQAPNAACVFNDVNKGNNSVACDAGSPNCSNIGSSGFGVVICNLNTTANGGITCPLVDNGTPAFESTTEYDLATGLGSINIGNLLTKWTSAIRTATTTTLSSPSGGSPSGQTFTATVAVSPAPANNEPVSLIALASDKTTVLGSYGPFLLTSGSATVTTNLFTPGTTYVEGSYGGDATLAASTSPAVALSGGAVTGTNQTSTLTVYYVGFDSNGNPTTPTTNSENWVYGSGYGYALKIVVTGSNGSCSFSYPNTKPTIPCPTGSIQLFDNGNPLTDFLNNGTAVSQTNLNNQGFAEDQPINVNVGTHNITATYAGDKNYAATTKSNTLTLTLTQAPTTTTVTSNPSAVQSGGSATLTAYVATTGYGQAPCGVTNGGTVQFTNNGAVLSGTVTYTPIAVTSTTASYCTATLTTAISSLYPPPQGKPPIPVLPIALLALSAALYLLLLRWMPQNRRRAYAFAGLIVFALLAVGIAGCSGSSSSRFNRTIGAAYSGDVNYKSSSGSTTIVVD